MKINGTLNTFAANLTKNLNVANKSNGANSAKEAQNATSTHQSSQEYLRNLRQKFSNMNITVANFKNKNQEVNYMKGCSGLNNIAISPNILDKMANDPVTAEKYEKIIDNVPNVLNEVKGKIESDPDCKLLAAGAMIEEDGNVSYWTYTCSTTTVEVNTGKGKMQERLEKVREKNNAEKKAEAKRKEKAEAEKALEEKQAEKSKEVSEQLNHIFSKGKDATEVISNIVTGKAILVSTGSSEVASIDVKV